MDSEVEDVNSGASVSLNTLMQSLKGIYLKYIFDIFLFLPSILFSSKRYGLRDVICLLRLKIALSLSSNFKNKLVSS